MNLLEEKRNFTTWNTDGIKGKIEDGSGEVLARYNTTGWSDEMQEKLVQELNTIRFAAGGDPFVLDEKCEMVLTER